ncbi:hypothetical protein D3C72_1811550 [compost metagenome]
MSVDRFGHRACEAIHQVALNGADHRRQVFGDAGRLEGRERHQVVGFYQALDRLQVATQIHHRADQCFGAGAYGHSLDALAIPPESQDVACFMEGSAARASVHDPGLVRAGR